MLRALEAAVLQTRRVEWAEGVGRGRRSGLTAKEFARSVGINAGTLMYWACRLGRERRVQGAASPQSASALGFVERIAGSGSDSRFELELGNGRRLRIPASFEDAERVSEALACIQALFLIERQVNRAPPAERRRVRQERSKPVVEKFFASCDTHREQALDGSPLADAIRYATNQQEALQRFLDDPRLPIHDNLSELHLRRQAVGRKIWLFVGSGDGAEVNTIFVSLLASSAMRRIEPWAYLRDLFCVMPGWPITKVLDLAPVNWPATLQQPSVQATLAANIFRRATPLDHQRAVA